MRTIACRFSWRRRERWRMRSSQAPLPSSKRRRASSAPSPSAVGSSRRGCLCGPRSSVTSRCRSTRSSATSRGGLCSRRIRFAPAEPRSRRPRAPRRHGGLRTSGGTRSRFWDTKHCRPRGRIASRSHTALPTTRVTDRVCISRSPHCTRMSSLLRCALWSSSACGMLGGRRRSSWSFRTPWSRSQASAPSGLSWTPRRTPTSLLRSSHGEPASHRSGRFGSLRCPCDGRSSGGFRGRARSTSSAVWSPPSLHIRAWTCGRICRRRTSEALRPKEGG
mmetsp:Transcript_104876/g.303530  ORF Transcript_104876/g.303530 Transcript_104876/m.303530 type:complete len:277 (-) Transcript_104876:551-1381(-)